MIQAVNFSTNNYQKANNKPSFAQNAQEGIIDYPQEAEALKKRNKKSKLAGVAGYIATQFAAGAIVSGIFDGLTNAYRAIRKNHALIPIKEIGSRAAFTGAVFAVIGLVFSGIAAAVSSKNKD